MRWYEYRACAVTTGRADYHNAARVAVRHRGTNCVLLRSGERSGSAYIPMAEQRHSYFRRECSELYNPSSRRGKQRYHLQSRSHQHCRLRNQQRRRAHGDDLRLQRSSCSTHGPYGDGVFFHRYRLGMDGSHASGKLRHQFLQCLPQYNQRIHSLCGQLDCERPYESSLLRHWPLAFDNLLLCRRSKRYCWQFGTVGSSHCSDHGCRRVLHCRSLGSGRRDGNRFIVKCHWAELDGSNTSGKLRHRLLQCLPQYNQRIHSLCGQLDCGRPDESSLLRYRSLTFDNLLLCR